MMNVLWDDPDPDPDDEDEANLSPWESFMCFVFLRPYATLCGVLTGCSVLYVVFAVCMGWRPW